MNTKKGSSEVIDLFLELVAINSPSGEEETIRDWILEYLHSKDVRHE